MLTTRYVLFNAISLGMKIYRILSEQPPAHCKMF